MMLLPKTGKAVRQLLLMTCGLATTRGIYLSVCYCGLGRYHMHFKLAFKRLAQNLSNKEL